MELFTADFTAALRTLVTSHHGVYPRVPPQGIFFEDLVARAFKTSGAKVVLGVPGQSREDMTVEGVRLSIKTETGFATRPSFITITKLSTTETDIWESELLKGRITTHLSHYEEMLMLRAIWKSPPAFHYQLLSIPIDLLSLIKTADLIEVGRRKGRRSIGGDVFKEGKIAFHVHFDGADGKCQVRNLNVDNCCLLSEWDHPVPSEWSDNWPIRTYETSETRAKKRAGASRGGPPSSEGPQLGLF